MKKLDLYDIIDWMENEMNNGNKIKTSKLYKLFYKYARLKYPTATEEQLRDYPIWYWR